MKISPTLEDSQSQDALSEELQAALTRVRSLAQEKGPFDDSFLPIAIGFLVKSCRADSREEPLVSALYQLVKMEASSPEKRKIIFLFLQKVYPTNKSSTYLNRCLESTIIRGRALAEIEQNWQRYYDKNQGLLDSFCTVSTLWDRFIATQSGLLQTLGIKSQPDQANFFTLSRHFWDRLGLPDNNLDELIALTEVVKNGPVETTTDRLLQWVEPETQTKNLSPLSPQERSKNALSVRDVSEAVNAAVRKILPANPTLTQVGQASAQVRQEIDRYFETSQAEGLEANFSTELMRSDKADTTKLNVDLIAKKAWIRAKLPRLHDEIRQVFAEFFPTDQVAPQAIAEIKLYTYGAIRGFIHGVLKNKSGPTLSGDYQDYVYQKIAETLNQGRGTETPEGGKVALVHEKIRDLVQDIYQRSKKKPTLSKALANQEKMIS